MRFHTMDTTMTRLGFSATHPRRGAISWGSWMIVFLIVAGLAYIGCNPFRIHEAQVRAKISRVRSDMRTMIGSYGDAPRPDSSVLRPLR